MSTHKLPFPFAPSPLAALGLFNQPPTDRAHASPAAAPVQTVEVKR